MQKVLCGLFLIAAVGFATPACVAPTADVTTIGSCQAGNLVFSNFGVSSVPTGMTVALSGISASSTSVDLSFQISGFSFTLPTNPSPDLRLVYEVTGLTTGVDNSFAGSPGTSIVETVCDSAGVTAGGGLCVGKVIAQLVDNSTLSPQSVTFLNSQSNIWIIKDITASASVTGLVSVSDITNSHETVVPEPATLSMMGLGLLGLGMIGRRRKV
jgi:hypothetical protein